MAAVTGTSIRWQLSEGLISLSIPGSKWPGVLTQWQLEFVEHREDGEAFETCLCSHYPIREVCHIVNTETSFTAIVGNCCVKKFAEELPSVGAHFVGTHKVFDAFKKITANIEESANEELIRYAYLKGALSQKDHTFYIDNWRKRTLSPAQLRWKIGLNRKIIALFRTDTERGVAGAAAVAHRVLAPPAAAAASAPIIADPLQKKDD